MLRAPPFPVLPGEALGDGLAPLRPPTAPKLFFLGEASDTVLHHLQCDGSPPERRIWDPTHGLSGTGLFRLKLATLPEIQGRRAQLASTSQSGGTLPNASQSSWHGLGSPSSPSSPALAVSPSRSSAAPAQPFAQASASAPDLAVSSKPLTRGQRYFELLMKSHAERKEGDNRTLLNERMARGAVAARKARRLQAKADRQLRAAMKKTQKKSDSDSSEDEQAEDEDEEDEDDELDPLEAYEGTMKIDVEVVVMRAPGEPELPDSTEPSARASSLGESGHLDGISVTGSERIDFSEELQELQQDMKVDPADGKDDEADDDNTPEGLRMRVENAWDNNDPRWSLGIGGTVFFIPDAERYALAPSLPPPPPPSLQGRRRLHLKPRLPLEISNHRYRDEHPFVMPAKGFCPGKEDRISFEQKLMTLDFYSSCSKALAKLPKLERVKDRLKHEIEFSRMIHQQLRQSEAWTTYRHRERLRRKEELELARREAEEKGSEAEEGTASTP